MNFDFKKELKKIIPKTLIEKRREHIRQDVSRSLYLQNEINAPGNYYSLNAFDYYKCIFIHIPKAAGISITKTLFGNLAGGHRTLTDYEKIYPLKTINQYYKFTITRNPYTRIQSAFHFLRQGGINEFDRNFCDTYLKDINSFDQFILDFLDEDKLNIYMHFVPQINYLVNSNNKLNVDFIGKFENLDADFKVIAKKLKINKPLPHLNKSQNNKQTLQLNKEVKNKIYKLYQQDFELLNYPK